MSNTLRALVVLGAAVMGCGQGNGQGIVMQRNLSLGLAKTIAEAALAECQAKGFHTSVVVVDRAGQMLVLLRDEQASSQTAEMARRKAYTARMFRITSMEFQKRTAGDVPYSAQRNVADVLALAGGAPINVGEETIGAVANSAIGAKSAAGSKESLL